MKEIKLSQGKVALVDDADYDWLNQWRWHAQNTKAGYYAIRKDQSAKCIVMHRLILGISEKNIKVDHRDRNGLNNQKLNLRKATHSQNMANRRICTTSSSKYLGVHWNKRDKLWVASVSINRKKYTIGSFKNEGEAAIAYNKRAEQAHGEFANLNKVA